MLHPTLSRNNRMPYINECEQTIDSHICYRELTLSQDSQTQKKKNPPPQKSIESTGNFELHSFLKDMDITTMLNSKGPVTTSEIHLQHLSKSSQMNVHNLSENNSEMGNNSDHSSGYSSKSAKALQAMPNMPNMRYQSPSQLQHPMPMLANGYSNPALSQDNSNVRYFPANYDEQNNVASRAPGNEGNKAFACQTCSKGFARRSDLARHGRHF